MSHYNTCSRALLMLSAAFLIGACEDDKPSGDALAQDTTLNRDLEMANQDSVAQPALQDVAVGDEPDPLASAAPERGEGAVRGRSGSPGSTSTESRPSVRTSPPVVRTPPRSTGGRVVNRPAPPRPTQTRPAPSRSASNRPAPSAPVASRPATRQPVPNRSGAMSERTGTTSSGNTVTRTPSGSERNVGTIPAGSTLSLASNARICTNTNRVGQRFNATVRESIEGSNGTRIPAGASATVEITELDRSDNINDEVRIGFRVVAVSFGGRSYPIDATTTYAKVDKVRSKQNNKDVQKVVGGAAVGAILGQVLGKDTKSTVIGAAGGAAAGTAAAAATAKYDGCVPSGGQITVTLDSSTQIQA